MLTSVQPEEDNDPAPDDQNTQSESEEVPKRKEETVQLDTPYLNKSGSVENPSAEDDSPSQISDEEDDVRSEIAESPPR